MAIEVTCPGCGKDYRVKDERAGLKIRCKECQSTIQVPGLDEDDYGEQEAAWDEPAPERIPSKSRTQKRAVVSSVSGAASFTARKIFGVLAILLALLMLAGVGMQVMKGNLRSLGGLIVVAGVASVGFKWLTT
jgi:predicted Zn finger-like uncharacterized protein